MQQIKAKCYLNGKDIAVGSNFQELIKEGVITKDEASFLVKNGFVEEVEEPTEEVEEPSEEVEEPTEEVEEPSEEVEEPTEEVEEPTEKVAKKPRGRRTRKTK